MGHCVPTRSKWMIMVPKNLTWIFMLTLIVLNHKRRNFWNLTTGSSQQYRVLPAKSARLPNWAHLAGITLYGQEKPVVRFHNFLFQCFTLLAWRYPKLKKKWPQNSYIFLIPLNIPDFATSIVFLICVRLLGGAAIIFSQSWNFELKFFVDNPYVKKIGTRSFWVYILPKNKVKI